MLHLLWTLFVATSVFVTAITPLEAAQHPDAKDIAFMQKAAENQLAEIALGRLALQKGGRKEVKQFGAEIIEDHQYASQEAKDLAAEEEMYLPVKLDQKHTKEVQRFSKLSGDTFDQAYILHVLNEHRRDLQEFEKNAATLHNEKVKQWAAATVPILEVHMKKAERVAKALGMKESK
jgi:putative membrane protein